MAKQTRRPRSRPAAQVDKLLEKLTSIWEDPDRSIQDKLLRTFRTFRAADPQGAARILRELEKEIDWR